jgi:hypothetical protein
MKGIEGDLGKMNIPLKPQAKIVQKIPYRLHPRYKEKVKDGIDKKMDVGIIKPIKEIKWIMPMVV